MRQVDFGTCDLLFLYRIPILLVMVMLLMCLEALFAPYRLRVAKCTYPQEMRRLIPSKALNLLTNRTTADCRHGVTKTPGFSSPIIGRVKSPRILLNFSRAVNLIIYLFICPYRSEHQTSLA